MDLIQRHRHSVRKKRGCQFDHLAFWLAIAVYLFLSCPGPLLAADNAPADNASRKWQISADKIAYDQHQDTYIAEGNVVVSHDGKTLSADQVHLNQENQEALAIGNVRLVSGKDIFSGRQLRMNLESEKGELNDGSLFFYQNHLYLSGDRIQKTGPQTYTADRATITACDGPDPDWKLTGRDLKVTIEGYGSAKHTALWAGNIPLLYSPYLIFPVKFKRQSGLLMPHIGYSERKGIQYEQPLFWAINDHSDATIYAHYMDERGVRTGVEYRYMLSQTNMGALFMEGYTDQRIDDGSPDSSKNWGYEDDAALRPNDDRYWVRLKHDHDLFWGLKAKLDLDVVSDQDYLHEFRNNYNGYRETRDYFRGIFGRDIDDEIDPIRTNRLNINRTGHHYSFNTDIRWYDDVIKRRQSETDDTFQQLPTVSIDGARQPIGSWPLYWELSSRYTNFYSEDDARWEQIDLSPRLSLPLRLFNAVTIAPSVGANATALYLSKDEGATEPAEKEFSRCLYDVEIDTQAEFYRLFNTSQKSGNRIKHAMLPQITYEYIPEKEGDELPDFAEFNPIAEKNMIAYSLINTLTLRSAEKAENEDLANYSYHTFLRFKLEQSFDILKDKQSDPEPFSDIEAELDITPKRFVRLDVDAGWSVYDDELTYLNTDLELWNSRNDRLTARHRFTNESSPGAADGLESVGMEAELHINDHWSVHGSYDHNIDIDKDIESSYGFSYHSQCWGIDFNYTEEENDQRYSVVLNLLSLGSVGSK